MTSTHGPCFCVITRVLATSVSIVTCQFAVALIFGQLKTWAAFTRHPAFGSLSADVSTAMVLVHTVHPIIRAVDAGVLVVTQEESLFALALITAHRVHANLLTSAVVVLTLVHIEAVMPIIREHEPVVARAPVVPGDVDAVVHTATVVVVLTLVHVFTVLAISFITSLADALEGFWSVLAQSIDVAVVCGFRAFICICDSSISHDIESIYEKEKQTDVPGEAGRTHGSRL